MHSLRTLYGRLRPRIWPILQTAAAAVAAWTLAKLLLPDGRPSFASIAAVICLGASYGQRGRKALELVGGVVLGISVASVIVPLIGTGSLQIGLMVLLAMSAAVLLGGGELLTAEAGVSAILLVSLDPASQHFTLNRILEGLIGGGVSLAVTSLFFPPDPALQVGRAAQAVFAGLGGALERLASALGSGDPVAAAEALTGARAVDGMVAAFGEALREGRETARMAPRRRASLAELERYEASFAQIDFAVRDTRVLARHTLRLLRSNAPVSPGLQDSVGALSAAVWELAGAYERPERADAARGHALRAGAAAREGADPAALEVIGQVRSTAVDLRRAADLVSGASATDEEAPTEELLGAAA